MKKIYITLILTLSLSSLVHSQIGIGTPSPDTSAVLHLESSNKGFLPPRVSLTATTDETTISNPAEGLIVYNIATAGVDPNNVVPGLMINTGTTIAPMWSPVNGGVTTNELTLSGKDLTSDVNGVTSTIDLTPVLTSATTVSSTLVGTDLSTTVNGVTGNAIDLMPAVMRSTTNSFGFVGKNLTSVVNGITASTDFTAAIERVTRVSNTISGKELTTTVNGVTATVDLTAALESTASNGLTNTNGNVVLGGELTAPTTITASSTNILEISSPTTGALRISDGSQGANKILGSDANGSATWVNVIGAWAALLREGNLPAGTGARLVNFSDGRVIGSGGEVSVINNSITVPSDGLYEIVPGGSTRGGTVGAGLYLTIWGIRVNNVTVIAPTYASPSGTFGTFMSTSVFVDLKADDVVTLFLDRDIYGAVPSADRVNNGTLMIKLIQ